MTYGFAKKKYSNQIKLSLWHVWVLYIFYFQISESRFIAFVRKNGITKSHKQEDGAMFMIIIYYM